MHQNKNQNKNKQHEPVLLNEILTYLDPKPGESFLDLTAGYGGHATAIMERTGSLRQTVLVDRDLKAVSYLKKLLGDSALVIQQDFYSASEDLAKKQRQFDIILADLGVSSPHLNEGSRGFSIQYSGPLDMRMDQSQTLTAEHIVNNFSETAIADILKKYGEEPKAKKIAHLIVANRPI